MHFLYFDPAIGALIIQAIVATVAGVLLFTKNLMFKVKSFFGLIKQDEQDLFVDIDIKDSEVENKPSSDK
jgi:hypothetical protein